MRWSDFIFDSVQVIYYKWLNFIYVGSYIDFLDWIKKIKATINWRNTYKKCFQYESTAVLNCEEI